MQLRETINKILKKKNWDQKEIAVYLDVGETVISRLGARWDEHWEVFLKLVSLCEELGIDPRKPSEPATAQQLKSVTAAEVVDNVIQLQERARDRRGTTPDGSKAASEVKKSRESDIPARGDKRRGK